MHDSLQPSSGSTRSVRCREIGASDLDETLVVLRRGFPGRPREHFVLALQRLTEHATPIGFPKYGYLLEVDGAVVGVVLAICSQMTIGAETRFRINVSSWYVDPEFRGYAAMLTARLRSYKQATFLDITPAPNTWLMLEALGYRRFANGGFFAVAALGRRRLTAAVRAVSSSATPCEGLSESEAALLAAHARFGCISVICEWKGRRYPFVFARRSVRLKGVPTPYAMLAYCRDFESYIQFAGSLGRFLLWRGLPLVYSDANGQIPELIGKYVAWGPKFSRGPNPPHLGDLAYTEFVMFE
jgi:hypothetical protein